MTSDADTPTVLICDDHPRRAEGWRDKIAGIEGIRTFEYVVVDGDELIAEIDVLSRRRDAARDAGDAPERESKFDHADIAILDYDLTPDVSMKEDYRLAHDQTAFTELQDRLRGNTGEMLAYLARCYSRVGYVVVVNQGKAEASFDLTLQRFASSKADLNVSATELVSAALWTGQPGGARFNAWSWPCLQDAGELWRRRHDAITLDGQVFATLGLDPARDRLAPRQIDVLTESLSDDTPTEPIDLTNVMFEDLVSSSLGLVPKDRQPDPELRRRIAVSAVGRWLDHWLLPGQNVLIDRPHVAATFPSALPIDAAEINWKSTDSPLAPAPLDGLEMAAQTFLQRPAWRLSQVRELARQHEIPDRDVQMVFCEDVSAFRPFDDAWEVDTDVPGPFGRRYVEKLDEVNYYPLTRLYQ